MPTGITVILKGLFHAHDNGMYSTVVSNIWALLAMQAKDILSLVIT
jgi:hypothetical protein